jgi:nucleotide-binding universal stress UspA family protein
MSIKTILVAVSGGSASDGAIVTAFGLARRLGAHVEAFHAHVDERAAIVTYGDGMGASMSAELLQRIVDESAEAAMKARLSFDKEVKRLGIPLRRDPPRPSSAPRAPDEASADWREETGYAPELITRRARAFDLVVLGRSDRVVDRPHSDAVEAAVLDSGRPVLLAPEAGSEQAGSRIALAWNDTVEATRALAAALPLMALASDVRILTVGSEDRGLGALAVEHLAWHGIAATARFAKPAKGTAIGVQLLEAARAEGADLLVMGAYGKAPWREMVFGGATREVIAKSLMPIMLVH